MSVSIMVSYLSRNCICPTTLLQIVSANFILFTIFAYLLLKLELAPIGCGCETGTDAPSSGEFFKLPYEGGCPCPRSHHTSSSPSGNSLKPCLPRERWTTR